MKRIQIADYTLRALSEERTLPLLFREKVAVAQGIAGFGADSVELAAVKNSKEDQIIYKTIASSVKDAMVCIPCNAENAAFAYECIRMAEKPCLVVELPVSDVQMEYMYAMKKPAMLEQVRMQVSAAAQLCPTVEFVAADASRADEDFLLTVIEAAENAGAKIVTVCDDQGFCSPSEISTLIKRCRTVLSVSLHVRLSDCISLGVANALAAVEAGCDGIQCAIFGKETLHTDRLAAALSARKMQLGAENGLDLTGIQRDIASLIKKISHDDYLSTGSATNAAGDVFLDAASSLSDIKRAVLGLGYDLSDEDNGKVYDSLMRICEKKSSVGARELEAIIASSAMQVPSTYHLKSYSISTGNISAAMAHIILVADDSRELSGVATGDGPIDAAFKAIEQSVGSHYELDDFQIQAVTEGKESLGSALVKLRSEGRLYSGNGLSTDTVGASIRAYINALNKIAYEENRQ